MNNFYRQYYHTLPRSRFRTDVTLGHVPTSNTVDATTALPSKLSVTIITTTTAAVVRNTYSAHITNTSLLWFLNIYFILQKKKRKKESIFKSSISGKSREPITVESWRHRGLGLQSAANSRCDRRGVFVIVFSVNNCVPQWLLVYRESVWSDHLSGWVTWGDLL